MRSAAASARTSDPSTWSVRSMNSAGVVMLRFSSAEMRRWPSDRGVAAVDDEDRAGHERRRCTREEHDAGCDLLREREALLGRIFDPVPLEFGSVDRSHLGLDV